MPETKKRDTFKNFVERTKVQIQLSNGYNQRHANEAYVRNH